MKTRSLKFIFISAILYCSTGLSLGIGEYQYALKIYQDDLQLQQSLAILLSEQGEDVHPEIQSGASSTTLVEAAKFDINIIEQLDLILAIDSQRCVVYRTQFGIDSYCQNINQ